MSQDTVPNMTLKVTSKFWSYFFRVIINSLVGIGLSTVQEVTICFLLQISESQASHTCLKEKVGSSLMTAKDLYLILILWINAVHSDLSLFSKYLTEPFGGSLRSKHVRGWILRFWPRKKCKLDLCRSNCLNYMLYMASNFRGDVSFWPPALDLFLPEVH